MKITLRYGIWIRCMKAKENPGLIWIHQKAWIWIRIKNRYPGTYNITFHPHREKLLK
jgi:hypothetical protein